MKIRRPERSTVIFASALLARVYIGIVLGLLTWSMLPLLLGWQPTVVSSGSMSPAVLPGDVLIAEPVNADSADKKLLQNGLVPLAKDPANPGHLFTHRIIGHTGEGYITQGDANPSPDTQPLTAESIIGIERLRIPFIGIPARELRAGNLALPAIFTMTLIAAQLLTSYEKKQTRHHTRFAELQRMPSIQPPSL